MKLDQGSSSFSGICPVKVAVKLLHTLRYLLSCGITDMKATTVKKKNNNKESGSLKDVSRLFENSEVQ